MTPEEAINLVVKEFMRASANNKKFNSAHEGFAVLKEEVDELWDEVKRKPSCMHPFEMRMEAVQVGAMAIRFLVDICE